MQKTRKKMANCKTLTKLSNAFNKLTHKIKTILKPSKPAAMGSKQKSEENYN
jgi:hypothetical protein